VNSHDQSTIRPLLLQRVMSVGQNGGLTRHDTTTRCLPGRAAGSMSLTDAYHARPPNEVVGFMAEQTTVYRLAVRHRSVGRHQTVTVHHVNTLFDLAAMASAAESPAVCLSRAPCTAAGVITRDECCGGSWAWWVPDCDGEGCLLPTGGFKFQLSIINRLIHNRLSIMEKIRK